MRAARAQATTLLRTLFPAYRRAVDHRLASLLAELEQAVPGGAPRKAGLEQLADALPGLAVPELWLVLATLHGEMPRPTQVRRLRRIMELDTAWDAIVFLLRTLPDRRDPRARPSAVAISAGVTHVDVTGLFTDDNVVAGRDSGRQILREWSRSRSFVPITWDDEGRGWRAITVDERRDLGLEVVPGTNALESVVLVPHAGTYILLGTVDEPRAAERLIGFGQYAGQASGTVGYGIDQLVAPEDHEEREGTSRFTWYLAAQRSADVLVAVGDGAASQYRGWLRMLSAVGVVGPSIVTVARPEEPTDTGVITLPGSRNSAWKRCADDSAAALNLQ